MPRVKGPRLYLAKSRDRAPTWVIRDGTYFMRTGALEHETEKAQDLLNNHLIKTGRIVGILSESRYHAPAPNATPGTIYFITCDYPDFPIKIGAASNLENRIRGLATALPYEVQLLGTCPGTYFVEGTFHRRFRHLRLRGEWFRRDKELLDYIAEHGTIKAA